ncbi:MAG: hypothetical protein P1V97_04970 [Planctomycetota bacterium]|nr:hypothetical protein [Planctomycetota bacterium]
MKRRVKTSIQEKVKALSHSSYYSTLNNDTQLKNTLPRAFSVTIRPRPHSTLKRFISKTSGTGIQTPKKQYSKTESKTRNEGPTMRYSRLIFAIIFTVSAFFQTPGHGEEQKTLHRQKTSFSPAPIVSSETIIDLTKSRLKRLLSYEEDQSPY